jgi:TRAP-type mannitol/chloroaromatic compound transport system permease small subunit
MSFLHGYRMLANRFAGVLGVISASLIFPTVAISIANVTLRRLGAAQGQNLTSNALIEAQWYLYGLMFVFGFAYILREGINVRVDFWFANLSSRTQSIIDLVGHLTCLLPFAYIGIRYSWPSVKLSWEQGEGSPDPDGLFRPPIKTALMMAFVFLAIQGIAEVIKNIEYLRGHELRHEDDNPALAGGQTFDTDDFDLEVGSGFEAEEAG